MYWHKFSVDDYVLSMSIPPKEKKMKNVWGFIFSEEEDECVNPLWGHDTLAPVIKNIDQIQELLCQGTPVTAAALFAAIDGDAVDTVELLLSAGIDPNARTELADKSSVQGNWASGGLSPRFSTDMTGEWFALYLAARCLVYSQYNEKRAKMMTALLERRPDIYATFLQPLKRRPVVYSLRDQISKVEPPPEDSDESDDERSDTTSGSSPPRLPPHYGIRSLIHAILEDGFLVKPILDFPGLQLDLEHRDPLGRTLLLSACRNALGADAAQDGALSDTYWDTELGCRPYDPFARPRADKTLLEFFISHGANFLAVDNQRKNALHHLLESHDPFKECRPPVIQRSLQYITGHYSSLVNQPDDSGMYPIHLALHRMRRYYQEMYFDGVQPDAAIDPLLEAGADPHVRDGHGNTVLHYLCADKLANQFYAKTDRRLFQTFLDRGVDVNLRNNSGLSALEMLLDDDHTRASGLDINIFLERIPQGTPNETEIDRQLLQGFDKAGVRWTEKDQHGNNLLHILARHNISRSSFRGRFLLSKGVDPMDKDGEGKTAVDIAMICRNGYILRLLKQKGFVTEEQIETVELSD